MALSTRSVVSVTLGENADNLRSFCGIDALKFSLKLDLFAVDHDRIFTTEFTPHFLDRDPHLLGILRIGKICKWFVSKFVQCSLCLHNTKLLL